MKFRNEYKHIINMSDLLQLRVRLGNLLAHDQNSRSDGTYYIKSLYFDNYMDKALREKIDGVNKREKFRIRYYNNDTTFIRLEKKSKINGLCHKESVPITAEEVERIIDGDFAFLLSSEQNLMKELYAKMHYQLLRPKSVVAYQRESFVHPLGNVRVTLDSDICGSYSVKDFLKPDAEYLQLYHYTVLEVKWDEYLPQVIRDITQVKSRSCSAFSKYAAVRF